jgi:class 3 adenylate cyclase
VAPPVQFARTADGRTIAYSAEGDGPTLVFARGWITHLELSMEDTAYAAFFRTLQPYLRVVRYDGRGNGLSDRDIGDSVTLDDLVLDIEAVVDAQRDSIGDAPVILWGSSFAGPAAIAFTARHPDAVAALILDGTYASGRRLGSPEQRDQFVGMLQMARVQPDGLFAAFSFLTDPDPDGGHDARVARLRQSISAEAVVALYSALHEFEVEDLLPSIDVPTLVMHRRRSRAVPFDRGRELAAGIRGARFVGLEGRAHNLWEERPHEALLAVGSFLDLGPQLADSLPPLDPPDETLPVAILFTDIVGSTELTGRIGDDDAQELVRAHNDIVRAALAESRGREVKHTGDGIMASFPAVSAAVTCAARIQFAIRRHNEQGADHPLSVRIGINAGEPLSEDDDLFGTVVQLSARVCARAAPDQIVVTNIVKEMVAGKGFTFDDLGPSELKGFPDPVHLWAHVWS